MNSTLEPDISTFETDFNVTFGHFICFDLMFNRPSFDLLQKGITNFIFTTMWFGELPFLTGIKHNISQQSQ